MHSCHAHDAILQRLCRAAKCLELMVSPVWKLSMFSDSWDWEPDGVLEKQQIQFPEPGPTCNSVDSEHLFSASVHVMM